MDFVHDQLAKGRKIRVLTVVDILSHLSPVVDLHFSDWVENVIETLESVSSERSYPRTIRVDQGSGSSRATWNSGPIPRGLPSNFHVLRKPTDNAFIEAFSGRSREEFISAHWFMMFADTKEKMETWLNYYTTERPHGAIGYKTPCELANPKTASGPSPDQTPKNSSLE